MSHIGNKIRSGFFATPERQGEYLKALLQVEGSGAWLDPTCGEGIILNQIAAPFNEDFTITKYGVELDKARALIAINNLDQVINAPIESMVIQNDALSLLFLNPPYDFMMKGMEDVTAERKEWTELFRNVRYLKDNGLMIYIIPSYRFADKRIARYLATHFYNIGIMRFTDEDYNDYKQCIFIGNKKAGRNKEINKKLFDFLTKMEDEEFIFKNVTPINQFVLADKKWKVPTGIENLKTFYTKLANKTDYIEGIKESKGFQAFINRTKPRQLEIGGDPILPLNGGQLALLLASGAVNGEIGDKENYHLVQGLELVKKIPTIEKKYNDNGTTTTITKIRTSREVSVKVICPSGKILKLV